MFNWCFIGAGKIAFTVAEELYRNNNNRVVSVYNRTFSKAEKFAEKYNATAYKNAIDAINDPRVDGVYIALTHNLHYEYIKLCLENNKPVLCEKSFVRDEQEARELFELAKKKNIYLSEAMWTWHNNLAYKAKELVKTIGKIQSVECAFSFEGMNVERLIKPEFYGGALYDIGIYGLRYSLELFGYPNKIDCKGETKNGVDINEKIILSYDGFEAIHRFAIDRDIGIYYKIIGEKGMIEIPGFHAAREIIFSSEKVEKYVDNSDYYDKQFTNVSREILEGKIDSLYSKSINTILCHRMMDTCFSKLDVSIPKVEK